MDVQGVLADLVDHGFEDISTERKLAVINETLHDTATREHWPILQKGVVLTFNGSSPEPSNHPADLRAVLSLTQEATNKEIRPQRIDDFRANWGSRATESGDPLMYYIVGGRLKFWPVPPSNAVVNMQYIYAPGEVTDTTVEADIWLPKRFHRGVIVNGSIYKLYLMEDDVELSREFERLYEKAIENMRSDLWVQHFESEYIHVVDVEDWNYD